MTDEEKWEIWRNKNAEIKKPYGESVHKHIVWYEGVDRRKAFFDGLAEGRKDRNCINCSNHSSNLRKENTELLDKLNLQNQRLNELKKENERLDEDKGQIIFESDLKIKALEEMIEKMKCYGNCKHWAETKGNCMLGGGYCICDMWELAE